ncbi:hypothetical protein PsorP6_009624 [Peronosclerospora sorghi]|uniref:Uncharacterized protein n=1 Tax=Peronosclerospora sorghi TaxID=230839 RepID=A0ACC0VYP0_9STRA|nr:hypothetical protein PsorP6_009624 [Peronosclerospora sorghi]
MKTQGMRVLAQDDVGFSQNLSVMTYNVLAQSYVKSSYFPYCKPSELRWKTRSKKLEAVFGSGLPVSPDVVCLQVSNTSNFVISAHMILFIQIILCHRKLTTTTSSGPI